MRVYLAGSLASNWQDLVMRVKGPTYLDPREGAIITCPSTYTPLNIGMIALSDVVIVYCEWEQTGLNRLVELGYAVGMGKIVVLISEVEALDMARVMADELFEGDDPFGRFMQWWEEFVGIGEKVWQRYSAV